MSYVVFELVNQCKLCKIFAKKNIPLYEFNIVQASVSFTERNTNADVSTMNFQSVLEAKKKI